ncbi:MAG: tRNA pseudouridine(38-40) synthase TruA [Desulfocapsaceae bacterium]|nr:tRNA pseudouridine(38-40) synthase TruA [Desulfocapsaceae bacterium]
MRNIKLVIAYDGTDFGGWQRQNNAPTIQGEIERRLAIMMAAPVHLLGAGRTDAGVHARGMVANFHTVKTISCEGLRKGLNAMLPRSIRILSAEDAPDGFHARFSARAKTYVYSLFTGPVLLPAERLYVCHVPYALRADLVKDCLSIITGTHDFASFELSGSRDTARVGGRGAIRTILAADLHVAGDGHYRFSITGDGFLRQMVRILVGTILEVGKGRLAVDDFQQILRARDRSQAGPPAPAHGLSLQEIYY